MRTDSGEARQGEIAITRPRRAASASRAVRVPWTAPKKFTSIARRIPSGSVSGKGLEWVMAAMASFSVSLPEDMDASQFEDPEITSDSVL